MLAGIPPELDMSVMLYVILGAAAGLKVLLYLYCVALQKQSETMMALAEDHRNDIMSSLTAILTGAVASWWSKGWWVDPVGGILISVYIIYAWGAICKEQVGCLPCSAKSALVLSLSLCACMHKSNAHPFEGLLADSFVCAIYITS